MLQQTQVERVAAKYSQFLSAFPDFCSLAEARLPHLLALWSGMGYNRRALTLRSLARVVANEYRGQLPSDREKLLALPGIGKYTAGAVIAFAFNKPVIFMDTNIRRVYIHEFFPERRGIDDTELLPLIQQTLDRKNPRKWYNALMDYGAMLKRKHVNPNRRSAHYARQSPFKNSNRQIRGIILKLLIDAAMTEARIAKKIGIESDAVRKNLLQLEREGFVKKRRRVFFICSE